jgi:hypothetical protein
MFRCSALLVISPLPSSAIEVAYFVVLVTGDSSFNAVRVNASCALTPELGPDHNATGDHNEHDDGQSEEDVTHFHISHGTSFGPNMARRLC